MSDNKSLEYFLKKTDDYNLAYENYIKAQEKIKVKALKASKSSLKHFKPLYDFLIKKNITNFDDIFLGIDDCREFFIREGEKIFFYDFVISSKKIIIEYNGKAWHPNWEKYDINEAIKNFKNKNINPIESINKDKIKIELAIKKGFDVLILWEEDGFNYNENKLKNYLKTKNIDYEN